MGEFSVVDRNYTLDRFSHLQYQRDLLILTAIPQLNYSNLVCEIAKLSGRKNTKLGKLFQC